MGQYKYKELITYYKKEISDGKVHPGDRLPSLEELSSSFATSAITVTRALNELQNEGYIKRIKGQGSFFCEAPEANQLSPSAGQKRFIYCIIPFVSGQTDLITSIEAACQERGYIFAFQNSNFSSARERELLVQARENGAAGIIVYPVSNLENIEIYSRMLVDRFPFVVLDRKISAVAHSFVSCANAEAFGQIVEYLCGKGHRRIAFLCGDLSLSSTQERFQGYCAALLRSGIPVDKELVVDGFYLTKKPEDETTDGMLRRLVSRNPRVTAIACANDLTASMILQRADKLGIRVPEDLSITGFDDMNFSSMLRPPLTTMAQPFHEIGRTTVKILHDMIEGKKPDYQDVRCPATLVERESVAAISGEDGR
jgi:GntR family transcriptional regulator, arabinose operon transcriptional repressor